MINPILCPNYEDYEELERVNASIGVPPLWEPERYAAVRMNERMPSMQECIDFVDSRIKQAQDKIDSCLTAIVKDRRRTKPVKPETIEGHRAAALAARVEIDKLTSIREHIEVFHKQCVQAYLDRR